MPDRIIRDEILESSRWVSLKDNADRLAYIALLLKADAHGNFTADPWRLLRLWRDFGIANEQAVAKTMAELVDHDLIRLYDHDGSSYLHIPRYRQQLRYTKRVLPRSPWCDYKDNQSLTNNSRSAHVVDTECSPSAHLRKKEVKRSDMKRSEVKEDPRDEPPSPNAATNAAATPQVKTVLDTLKFKPGNPNQRTRHEQIAFVKAHLTAVKEG